MSDSSNNNSDNKNNKNNTFTVIKLPVPDIPNAYFLISGREHRHDLLDSFRAKPTVSLLYDSGEVAAEWEVEYGPIQIWFKCTADTPEAVPHYFYEYHNSPILSWSQLAVEREGLPEAFVAGNYQYVFEVLKRWAEHKGGA